MELSCKQTTSYQDKVIRILDKAPNTPLCNFNAFEDNIIRKYFPLKGAEIIAKALHKDTNRVMKRAAYLGVKRIRYYENLPLVRPRKRIEREILRELR